MLRTHSLIQQVILCLIAATLVACSSYGKKELPAQINPPYQPQLEQNSIQTYIERLAHQLMINLTELPRDKPIAIGTFTPVQELELTAAHDQPLIHLGYQLQEGLMTAMQQLDFHIVEYRTRQDMMIKEDQDLMLSRNVNYLTRKQALDYYLTGTLVAQEQSIIVNARLVDINTLEVIAASSQYIPRNVFWSEQKVQQKAGKLYRTSY